jgi:hypothetical protein
MLFALAICGLKYPANNFLACPETLCLAMVFIVNSFFGGGQIYPPER